MSLYSKIIFGKINHRRIKIRKQSCNDGKEKIFFFFLNSFVQFFPLCIRKRLNFLALVTKLSAPEAVVINQLSWHTIKKSGFKKRVCFLG